METSCKIQKKLQPQQKSFILPNKKEMTCIKVTNITFTKEDMSEFDLLMNLRNKSSFSIKGQQSQPNILSLQNFAKSSANKEVNEEVYYPKKRYHKCSNQTKISQMFFVRSMNLQSKPTPPRLLSHINNLNAENKQNEHKDIETKEGQNSRIFRSIDSKKHLSNNSISSATLNHNSRKDHDKKNTLQPLNGFRNQNKILISNTVVELKKSNCIFSEGINQKKNRNSQSQKQKNIDRIQTQPRQLKDKQRQMPSPPKINFHFTTSNLKDSLLQGKLMRYWQDLDKTARLHKMQINILDYQKTPIKYYVGKGNNSRLIKQVMKKRWWWAYSDEKSSNDVYFIWLQLKDKSFYKRIEQFQQELNHVERNPNQNTNISNRNISSKSYIHNEFEKCKMNSTSSSNNIMTDSGSSCQNKIDELSEKTKISKGDYQQSLKEILSSSTQRSNVITCKITGSEIQGCSQTQINENSAFGSTQISNSLGKNKNISPDKKGGYSPSKKMVENCQIQQFYPTLKNKPIRPILSMHNHYQHNQFLGNKKALFYCMRKYYKSTGQNVFDFLPLTFHVQSTDQRDEQFEHFKRVYSEELNKNKRKRLWILKPGENSNRGKGITIHSDFEQIVEIINNTVGDSKQGQQSNQANLEIQKKSCQSTTKRTFIIQQYIEKPFLYNRRKFDIRCFILLTSLNGSIKGYWYREGYIRTSCFQFSLDSYNNSFVHLTNDAIQKNCEEYGKYQLGNKLSYQTFKRYLAFKYQKNKKYDFDSQIYEKLRNVAIDSIKASYHMLDNRKMKSVHSTVANHTVFQVFGLDFMIDQNFQPWLIQVNTNPCLETTCPVLEKIIPKMLDDALKLSVDVMYPPPAEWPSSKKHFLGSIGSNGFQLVFDQQAFNNQLRKNDRDLAQTNSGNKNSNKMYEMEGIGQIEEDDQIYEEQEEQ